MNSIRHSVRHSIARMGGSRLVGLRWIWGGNSALDSWGWFESLRTGVPCDRNGSPIPWISYPAVFILRDRVKSTFRVFEFGSGYSTLWWAKNVAHVTSCEHDADWSRTIAKDAPDNVTLLSIPLDEQYPLAACQTGETYNILVVDGRKRTRSALSSIKSLQEDGVIVWDDTDRPWYQDGIKALRQQGFRQLDLVGFSPLVAESKQTSIFYRTGNCLGL